jgi:hypothetical protein
MWVSSSSGTNNKSGFVQRLITNGPAMGKIADTMKVVYRQRKSRHLDTLERYYIHKETKKGTQINDKNTVFKTNKILDTIVHCDIQQLAQQPAPCNNTKCNQHNH